MRDPFKIDSPTCISFSGGRTSAYMLHRVLESNGGLPGEAVVCFANTGKEDEATLRFVRDCAANWSVPINWLEYTGVEGAMYRVMGFNDASREGQPFEALIRRRQFLPNPVSRFCTSELKIRTMHRFIRAALEWPEWDQFIGIRADEQRRVAKIRARGTSTETKDETMCMPLADAGITVQDINRFWSVQPFNLELATHDGRTLAGNCDLCFLKPPRQRASLIAERPSRAVWWVRMEALALSSLPKRFKDEPQFELVQKPGHQYAAELAEWQNTFDDYDDESEWEMAEPSKQMRVPVIGSDGVQVVLRTELPSTGARFCKDNEPSYAAMLKNATNQADAFGHDDEEALACFCGD